MYVDLYEAPVTTTEVVGASLREIKVHAQIIELRVDATMIQFEVDAILVASNTNALRRLHFFYDVTFTDGLEATGAFFWPDEVVVFSEDGLEVVVPIHWGDDEAVILAEQVFKAAWSIQYNEFARFEDYAISYVLDFLASERFSFADMSIAWTGLHRWDEQAVVTDGWTVLGGNAIGLNESVTISETVTGGPAFIFGDAVFWQEFLIFVMDFLVQPEAVTFTDALVVSEVAATDARPGAFIPGSALLGSPQ